MVKKYKKIIFGVISLCVLLLAASPVLALELNYPSINFPGAPTIGNRTSAVQYVQYFFMFLVVGVGMIAVISIAYYGARILVFAAMGNPDAIADARKNIFGSILGIVLLMFSFILLRTINPELVTLKDDAFVGTEAGVYYGFWATNPDNNQAEFYKIWAGDYEKDMRGEIDENDRNAWFWNLYDFTLGTDPTPLYLFYSCDPKTNTRQYKDALIWVYQKTNFEIDANANTNPGGFNLDTTNQRVVKIKCGERDPERDRVLLLNPGERDKDVLSWKWDYEEPGVYFYLTNNCSGISSPAYRENTNTPYPGGSPPNTEAKSVKIVNGRGLTDVYGTYLVNQINRCAIAPMINPRVSPRITSADPDPSLISKCYEVINMNGQEEPFNPRVAYVFNYRTNIQASSESAIQLDSGTRYADLTVNWLRDYNGTSSPTRAPGAGVTTINDPDPVAVIRDTYKLYIGNPDRLLADPALRTVYQPDGDPGDAAFTNISTLTKYLRFNLRNSYAIFFAASRNNDSRLCNMYVTSRYLPFDEIRRFNRLIYQMAIIPIYRH